MFSKLPDYLEWANTRCIASIESLDAPGDHLRSLFGHILAAEEHWFARLGQRDTQLANWPSLSLGELRSHIRTNASTCRAILMSTGGIGGTGTADWIVNVEGRDGSATSYRASDIFMHVFAHGAYHRGQIASGVKRLGGQPAETDYIRYCFES